MSSWYYASADRQRHGPLTSETLKGLAAAGTVDARTLVWRDGLAGWVALADVAAELGLDGIATPAPVPPVRRDHPYAAPTPAAQAPMAARAPVEPIPTHLVWAILSTLCCCWPLGVVSIVYACRVDRRRAEGDVAGAWDASRKARLWAIWSALSLVLIFLALVCLAALDGAFR